MRKTLALYTLGLPKSEINAHEIIMKNMAAHNIDKKQYDIKVINDIIYDERKNIVCVFKDYLLWDENSDFLKR